MKLRRRPMIAAAAQKERRRYLSPLVLPLQATPGLGN